MSRREAGEVMTGAAKVAWSALGTTAEVVVTDADALSRRIARCWPRWPRSTRPAAASGRTPSWSRSTARPAGPCRSARCSARRSTSPWRRRGAAAESVDPTVGAALLAAGYDDDFARLPADGPADRGAPRARLARRSAATATPGTVTVPRGVQIDLGATAKALAADRAARAAALAAPGVGVLVSLGGDVAVAGPPPGDGWPVGVADDHRDGRPAATVLLREGGLATSSVTQRRWRRGGRVMHHILDPRTGAPVAPRVADGQRGRRELRRGQHGQHRRDRVGRAGPAPARPGGRPRAPGRRRRPRRDDRRVAGLMALWYLMRATGVAALVMLTATLVMGIVNVRRWAPRRDCRASCSTTRTATLSLLVVALLAIHVVTAVVDRT